MWMITWYDDGSRKVCTVVADEPHTLLSMACMLEDKKIKYKVTDRLGLITPKIMGWSDFDYWVTGVDDPLY
jgi:hypothetical protein